jgi:hypothetical protein
MDADLDTLCITVYCMADDLLPRQARNHRRDLNDAEVITLAVAQAIMGIPSDERFLAVARRRLRHLFPKLPKRPGYWKRRRRLGDRIEALIDVFARECPGYSDPVVLLDSTPVECGRSRETVERSELADAAGYGYCQSHSRYFWGMRLHACFGLDGTPRGAVLWSADRPEREVALELLPRLISGGEAVVCDKGYASRDFEARVAELGALVVRPTRKDEKPRGFRPSAIRQRIESVYQTLKDILTLERHGARTLENLRIRVAQRLLALAASVYVNHWLGRPSRSLVAFVA